MGKVVVTHRMARWTGGTAWRVSGCALALSAVLGGPALAQAPPCDKREAVLKLLESPTWGETRQSYGLQQGIGLVEVWANKSTGSWTIIATNAKGRTCLIAAGTAFEREAPKEGQEG